jgi:hypothetical protein
MWSSMPSTSARHASDAPSISDVQVGKKKTTVKFPCMLCKCDHYSHLCPHMDEASSLLEKLKLPKGYHKLSPNPSLVDGLVNPVPCKVNPVDPLVSLVSSSIEPLTKVVDPVPSLVSPTLHLQSEPKVTDPVPSLVSPTLHSKSVKVVDVKKTGPRSNKIKQMQKQKHRRHTIQERQIYVVHPVWDTSTREIARSFLYYYPTNEGIQPTTKPAVTSSSFSHSLLSQNTIFTLIHSCNTFPS